MVISCWIKETWAVRVSPGWRGAMLSDQNVTPGRTEEVRLARLMEVSLSPRV